jgi:hypothetical protein
MIQLSKKRDHNAWKSNEIKLDADAIKISNEQLKHVQRVEDSIQLYFESTTDVERLFDNIHHLLVSSCLSRAIVYNY